MTTAWTDELRKEVCALWDKQSASQIVLGLNRRGYTFSRNAVIGVIHRAGLSIKSKTWVHPSTTQNNGAPRVSVHTGELNRARARTRNPNVNPDPFICAVAADIVPLGIQFSELDRDDCKCRWPLDAPAGADGSFVFCGLSTPENKPYCAAHGRLAHQTPKESTRPRYIDLGKAHGGIFGRTA